MEPDRPTPDTLTIVSYMIAAAFLLPLGWWLKASWAPSAAAWLRGLFY